MTGYQCPECGGHMHSVARLSDPPIYEAKCYDCGVLYRRRARSQYPALPRDYERVTPPTGCGPIGETE